MARIRRHLTFANVASAIALFVALTGGTAVALTGVDTVQSDDLGPGAQVKQPDVADGAVNSPDVVNESLTGLDIKDRSGVETCPAPATLKFGPICAGSDGGVRAWRNALNYCAGLRLRLPSNSEAVTLAKNFDVPGVGTGTFESFWTDEAFVGTGNQHFGAVVDEDGVFIFASHTDGWRTVCVTDPSA